MNHDLLEIFYFNILIINTISNTVLNMFNLIKGNLLILIGTNKTK